MGALLPFVGEAGGAPPNFRVPKGPIPPPYPGPLGRLAYREPKTLHKQIEEAMKVRVSPDCGDSYWIEAPAQAAIEVERETILKLMPLDGTAYAAAGQLLRETFK